ncbi:MAG: transposase [Burkholderiaceae bacterium]
MLYFLSHNLRLTSEIHAVVDALGNPVRRLLTGGEVADIMQAKSLPATLKLKPCAVLADKGYDANKLIDYLQATGAQALIPPKRNRFNQREYDRHLYKDRNFVERFLTASNHSDGSQRVMKNWHATTFLSLISSALTFGSFDC